MAKSPTTRRNPQPTSVSPTAQNQPQHKLEVQLTQLANQPLEIKMAKNDIRPLPKWQRPLLISLAVLPILISSILWAIFIAPQIDVPPTPSTSLSDISIGYIAPLNVSIGDNNITYVTIVNSSVTPLNANLNLVFNADAPILVTNEARTTSAVIKDLPAGARITIPFSFLVTHSPSSKSISFFTRITLTDGRQSDSKIENINIIWFIPRLNFLVLAGISLFSSIASLITPTVAKLFFPELK